MKTIAAVLVFLFVVAGCGKKEPGKPKAVENWVSTPLPVPPPPPDAAPTAQNIAGAKTDVSVAQQNVRQVLTVAQATPGAAAAVPPLNTADARLTAALEKLESATQTIQELDERLSATEKAHQDAENIMRGDIDTLKKAAATDNAQAKKQVDALQKENADLRDESIREAKKRLMWMGILLIIGSIGSIAASFYLGFAAGPKLAFFMAPAGAVLITLSQLLDKIVFWGEVTAAIVAVGLCGWLLWHAFHHDPLPIPKPPESPK